MRDGARFFVTGATGLIGSALCRTLVRQGFEVVAFVRDPAKARMRLDSGIELCVGDVTEPIRHGKGVDYLIHAAGETSSAEFVRHPAEVVDSIVSGTRNALKFAREKNVRGMVFLSTMEVYGLTDSENVDETDFAALDTMTPRSCYPEAKRLSECLCASMANEYGVPVKVARLTQTFGAGVRRGDKRVFAQFAEAVLERRDIVLKGDGKTARCYCSVEDAVSAILTILEKGTPGLAYNVANPDTFCTIREMAELVSREFSAGRSKVVVEGGDTEGCGYLPPFRMKLSVDRLSALGWKPRVGLKEMYGQLIASLKGSSHE